MGLLPIYKKAKTITEKKPKSKSKAGATPHRRKHIRSTINPLPVRDTQLTQISIQELADAKTIITDPKVNPDLLGPEGNDETTQPTKRKVIP